MTATYCLEIKTRRTENFSPVRWHFSLSQSVFTRHLWTPDTLQNNIGRIWLSFLATVLEEFFTFQGCFFDSLRIRWATLKFQNIRWLQGYKYNIHSTSSRSSSYVGSREDLINVLISAGVKTAQRSFDCIFHSPRHSVFTRHLWKSDTLYNKIGRI